MVARLFRLILFSEEFIATLFVGGGGGGGGGEYSDNYDTQLDMVTLEN